MRFVRLAYIEKTTSIIDRLYYAWCAVFTIRIWSASLEKASVGDIQQTLSSRFPSKSFNSISKRNLFISMPTLFSLELNAHSITYLLVLVAEKQVRCGHALRNFIFSHYNTCNYSIIKENFLKFLS
jgi:hypothetical protein